MHRRGISWGRGRCACVLRVVGIGLVVLLTAVGVALADPGDPVTGFGTDGVVDSQFSVATSPETVGESVVTAPDGDIYVGGLVSTNSAQTTFAAYVARYTPAGVLDATFGTNGVTIEQLGVGSAPSTGPSLHIALGLDGRVVLAGYATDASGHTAVAVMELTAAGQLDPAFASGGILRQQLSTASTPNSGAAGGVAVQSDGDVVITGQVAQSGSVIDDFMAERLEPDGTPDPTFANNGLYVASLSVDRSTQFSEGEGVLIDPNGDLVFGLAAYDANGDTEFGITRLTPSGSPDPNFSTDYVQPVAGSDPDGSPSALARQADGDYVLAGSAIGDEASHDDEVAVARFTGTGALDVSFGNQGTGVYVHQVSAVGTSEATGVDLQANGRIVLTGYYDYSTNAAQFVMRLTPEGTLDPSFGGEGIVERQLGSGSSASTVSSGSTITSGGQLLTAGGATEAGNSAQSVLSEVELDAPPTVSFGAAPSAPVAGQPVTFAATATPGEGDTIAAYGWNLGTGNSSFTDASGATVTTTFASPGTYTVAVQATDDDGVSSTSTQTITVAPAPSSPPASSGPASGGPASGGPASTGPTPSTTAPVKATPVPKLTVAAITVTASAVSVKLSCQTAACSGTLALTTLEHRLGTTLLAVTAIAKRHSVRVSLGGARFSLSAGRTETVTVRLSGAAKALLSRFGHLPATLTVTLSDVRPAVRTTRRLTFKQPGQKRKRG